MGSDQMILTAANNDTGRENCGILHNTVHIYVPMIIMTEKVVEIKPTAPESGASGSAAGNIG